MVRKGWKLLEMFRNGQIWSKMFPWLYLIRTYAVDLFNFSACFMNILKILGFYYFELVSSLTQKKFLLHFPFNFFVKVYGCKKWICLENLLQTTKKETRYKTLYVTKAKKIVWPGYLGLGRVNELWRGHRYTGPPTQLTDVPPCTNDQL